jgi:peptide chain release factor 3
MDREALDPFALLDEIHERLALDPAPMYWPCGSGQRFAGMLDLANEDFLPFRRLEAGEQGLVDEPRQKHGEADYLAGVSDELRAELAETSDLARGALPRFDPISFQQGHMTPVYFGSALRRFGVLELLAGLGACAPGPRAQAAFRGEQSIQIEPGREEVTGFVFKIQANMDPRHRDRVGFYRICSGRFRRGMTLKTTGGKALNVHNPLMFLAQDRELADEAFPGDIVGIPNHGTLRVGDSLSESGEIAFQGMPNFAPEILKLCRVRDPLKQKHLRKALDALSEEGVTQCFRRVIGGETIVGAVGALQFDVLEERMKAEYGLEIIFEPAPYQTARWIGADSKAELEAFAEKSRMQIAEDAEGALVFLGKSVWEVGYVQEKNPNIRFNTAKERAG